MPKKSKSRKQTAAKKKSQPYAIVAEGNSSPNPSRDDLIAVDEPHLFSVITERTVRGPQQGLKFKINDDQTTSAEPCIGTPSQVQYTYQELLPDFHQARTFVMQCKEDETPPTVGQLKQHLRGTQLSTVADDRDLNRLIVRCIDRDKGPMTTKALTRSFIRDKTAFTDKTLSTYFSRAEKEPRRQK